MANTTRNRKIGVFDSGLGGLAILKGILKDLPEYDFIYLGDNARVPYGGRSPDTIYKYTKEAVKYLFQNDCQLVIFACNTTSTVALRKIQKEWLPENYPKRNILGVLVPAIEAVVESGAKKVGLIGTYTTARSDYFPTELSKRYPDKDIKVIKKACPLLVPIIEEGELEWDGLESILRKYLEPLLAENIDTLVLGCTHYELIADKIRALVGNKVNVIAEGEVVGKKFKEYLGRHPEVERHLSKNGRRDFTVTDYSERYQNMAKLFFGEDIKLREVSI